MNDITFLEALWTITQIFGGVAGVHLSFFLMFCGSMFIEEDDDFILGIPLIIFGLALILVIAAWGISSGS